MLNLLFSLTTATEQMPISPSAPIASTLPTSHNFMQIISQVLPFVLIAIIFYLFIIRPQNQQRKQLESMINNLKIGDKIITKGGLIGKINIIQENTVILELFDGNKVEILKHAIISMLDGDNN